MNKKLGRNDSCHCGSGKKYKVCHGQFNDESYHRWIIVIVLVLIMFWFFFYESEPSFTAKNSSPNSLTPQTSNRLSQPPETAPPGKVWSPEHGHWHDVADKTPPSGTRNQILNKPQTQPTGEAPPGKVWSPEHGHWHDE